VRRDEAGAPSLVFHGAVAEALKKEGLRAASVSLSHSPTQAIAVVLLFP
jgi:phosphopantetheinyl transferase (holo-ACP synthase)